MVYKFVTFTSTILRIQLSLTYTRINSQCTRDYPRIKKCKEIHISFESDNELFQQLIIYRRRELGFTLCLQLMLRIYTGEKTKRHGPYY